MKFRRPDEGEVKQDSAGYQESDLEGVRVAIAKIQIGESVTRYSEGLKKPCADCEITPLEGPGKGVTQKSRLFGGYVVTSLRGYHDDHVVLAKVVKGVPRPGLKEGWVLQPVEMDDVIAELSDVFGQAVQPPPF